MSSDLISLALELNNPLYLFPIVGVLFTALLVFAFGFKSSTQPSDEVFDALNDKHHKSYRSQEVIKKKKPNKITNTKPEPKSKPNGHVTDGSVKSVEKKSSVESKSSTKTATNAGVESKTVTKRQTKSKKNENLIEKEEMEDKDSGEWVELISKKERKNRKQKEEQNVNESVVSKKNKTNKTDKKQEKSPKKESKKSEVKKIEKSGVSSETNVNSKTTEKATKTEDLKSEDKFDEKQVNGLNSVSGGEEQVSEELDIYELAKEQRVGKKWQKRNQKRGSESEVLAKNEPSDESEVKSNLDISDKLTASIVANYETNDHNKSDSISNANNKKKKDKNKKKPNQTQVMSETNDKIASIGVIGDETNGNSIDIPNEIKPSEEEEFKSVGKKRRARRE